jgi:hypothetical protein|tara:strand:- start:2218 stop:2595 length:378 start_codon:yes stop_codon:yes gene_type:complete
MMLEDLNKSYQKLLESIEDIKAIQKTHLLMIQKMEDLKSSLMSGNTETANNTKDKTETNKSARKSYLYTQCVAMITQLKKNGWSQNEIGKALGYKSNTSLSMKMNRKQVFNNEDKEQLTLIVSDF